MPPQRILSLRDLRKIAESNGVSVNLVDDIIDDLELLGYTLIIQDDAVEKFYSIYASRVPNFECCTCGNFQLPGEDNRFARKFLECPECGRQGTRYYIPIGEEKPLEEVPLGYVQELLTDNDGDDTEDCADEILRLLREEDAS